MYAKIGDKIHDSEYEPIMIILSEQEKNLIAKMDPKANRFCVYPDGEEWTKDNYKKIKEWMILEKFKEKLPKEDCTCHPNRTSDCTIHGYSDLLSKRH